MTSPPPGPGTSDTAALSVERDPTAADHPWPLRLVPTIFRDLRRLVRYAIGGSGAATAHLGSTALLVELGGLRPVVASSIGFVLGVVVSYLVQKHWVFASGAQHRIALPKFLTVTAVGWTINWTVLYIGTEVMDTHYILVQAVAFVLLPLNNFVLNSLWTFKDH